MRSTLVILALALACVRLAASDDPAAAAPRIVVDEGASSREVLAAREIRRYLYLRTSRLAEVEVAPAGLAGEVIAVGTKDRPALKRLAEGTPAAADLAGLGPESYLLESVERDGARILLIIGGDETGALYGAYAFAERLGVRFYLHGDVVPDQRIALDLGGIHERQRPALPVRGIQDTNSGLGWSTWTADAFLATVEQAAKQRLNLVQSGGMGFPWWWGAPTDVRDDGTVTWACDPGTSFPLTAPGEMGRTAFGIECFCPTSLLVGDVLGPLAGRDRATLGVDDWIGLYARIAAHVRPAHRLARQLGIRTALHQWDAIAEDYPPAPFLEHFKQAAGYDLSPLLTSTDRPAALAEAHAKDPRLLEGLTQAYRARFRWATANFPLDAMAVRPDDNVSYLFPRAQVTDAVLQPYIQHLAAMRGALAGQATPLDAYLASDVHVDSASSFQRLAPKDIPIICGGDTDSRFPLDDLASAERIQGRTKWIREDQDSWNDIHGVSLWVGRSLGQIDDGRRQGCTGAISTVFREKEEDLGINAVARIAWDGSRPARRVVDGVAVGTRWRHEAALPGVADGEIYQSGIDTFWYRVAIPNGRYALTCHFREFDPSATAGARVFDVDVSTQADPIKRPRTTVIPALDIAQRAGGVDKPLVITVPEVVVSDGCINLEGRAAAGSRLPPILCAFEIRGQGYERKVRLGGPAHAGFEGEWRSHDWNSWACTMARRTAEFYDDWARQSFGAEAAPEISRVFQELDSALPVLQQNGDFGSFYRETGPWSEFAGLYRFIDRLEELRPRLRGDGDRARFDWWLDNFRYLRAVHRALAKWYEFDRELAAVQGIADAAARREAAQRRLVPIHREIIVAAQEAITAKIQTAASFSAGQDVRGICWCLGTDPDVPGGPVGPLGITARELKEVLGGALPDDLALPQRYAGRPLLVVPAVRTQVFPGEAMSVRVWYVDNDPPAAAQWCWRPLGRGAWQRMPLRHVHDNEYALDFTDAMRQAGDVEYYLEATTAAGTTLRWPATAPDLAQTVIALPR